MMGEKGALILEIMTCWHSSSLSYNLSNCRHDFNYRWAGGARPRTGLGLVFAALELLGSEDAASPWVLAALLAPPPGLAAPSWDTFKCKMNKQVLPWPPPKKAKIIDYEKNNNWSCLIGISSAIKPPCSHLNCDEAQFSSLSLSKISKERLGNHWRTHRLCQVIQKGRWFHVTGTH